MSDPETTADPQDSTRTLGRYRITGELGRGAFGVVYRGVDPTLGRAVAVKMLHPEGATPMLRARLRREAELAARLQHPGVVRVHEIGRADGVDFIVMDCIDGRTLAGAAADAPLERRVDWLAQVAEAVGHAHAAGVLHRDLKPANVLVTPDGRAVVTDFGLARAADVETLTRTGDTPGTLAYMAPEQLSGDRDQVGPPADVWALGVMLYQLLVGHRPFDGPTAGATIARILAARPAPLPRAVPRPLARICRMALTPAPGERYADAGALGDDLRRWQRDEPVAARVRRRPGRRTLAAALALVLLAGWGVAWTRRRQAFAEARDRALAAHAAGDWADALAAGERALAIAPDARLTRLLARVRQRLAAERAARDADGDRRAAARGRAATLDRVARRVERTRGLFYIAGADVRAELEGLEDDLGALARLLEAPPLSTRTSAWTLLGMGWYFSGRLARATAALERALQLTPGAPRAAHFLQRVCIERSQLALLLDRHSADGRRLAERARRLGPAAAEAALGPVDRDVGQAFAALAAGDTQTVRRICEAGIAAYPDALGVEWLHLALGWVVPGEAALGVWTRGLERCPHAVWLLLYRGSRRLVLGRHAQALADLDRVVQLNPHLSVAYTNRAAVRVALRQYGRALRDAERALALDPDSHVALANRGTAHLRTGRLDAARADAERLLRAAPGHPAGFRLRSTLRELTGDLRGALADADRVLERSERPGDYRNRAMLRSRAGDDAGALSDYEHALARAPGHPAALAGRGLLRLGQGALDAALADAERVLAALPDDPDARVLRGEVRRRRGQLAAALADFDAALAARPDHATALLGRGALHAGRRDWRRALADFTRASRAAPGLEAAWVNRARALHQLGRPRAALADYGRALAINPGRAVLWYERATLRHGSGDLEGAASDLQRALELEPDHASALTLRGQLHARGGRLEAALRDLARAVRLAPDSWVAWQYYAHPLWASGRREEARAALRRALELAPPASRPPIARVLKQLSD